MYSLHSFLIGALFLLPKAFAFPTLQGPFTPQNVASTGSISRSASVPTSTSTITNGKPSLNTGTPTSNSSVSSATATSGCGIVEAFYGQTPADWVQYGLDEWLNAWITNNSSAISANPDGFAGAFGAWAVGNPDFSCLDDGSSTDCDFDPCNIPTLNAKGPDVREAYYVMESLTRIHTYFMGLRQAFTVSAIGAALSKDSWATTFYHDKDDVSVGPLKELFNFLTTIVGIGATFAGLAGPAIGAAASAFGAEFSGAIGAVSPLIAQHQDDTFQKSADLGAILGNIVVGSIESFTSANNVLMQGGNYDNSGDIRGYLAGGSFVAFPGVDKNAVTNMMNAFLIGQAVNQLYRVQKIFIMGGGACGDNQGIGSGPQEASVCRDGKAWYLYYWQENDVISVTSHQWGWVASPPGADQLGQGSYSGVQITDIINASLDAYNVAGYSYTNATAAARAESALKEGWRNPGQQGPSWEGTFTIPVCDIGAAVNSDYQFKEYILQDYGHDSRPVWCGPICSGSVQQTQAFIAAAQMNGFESPRHLCSDTPADEQWW